MISQHKISKGKIVEFLKFNAIGMSNFVLSQMLYITLFLFLKMNYIVAYTITSILSITASYFFNSKFTFKENNYSTKKFSQTFLLYVVEYSLNMLLIIIMVKFGISKILAPIIAPVFTTPPVFFIMRKIIKKGEKKEAS